MALRRQFDGGHFVTAISTKRNGGTRAFLNYFFKDKDGGVVATVVF